MTMTPEQTHVLDNIDRVVPLSSKSANARFQLDGIECTAQIDSLVADRWIRLNPDGGTFKRLNPDRARGGDRVGQRQQPLTGSLDAIKALFSPSGEVEAGKKLRVETLGARRARARTAP